MAYGICRIQKLKAGSLGGSAQHTARQRYTPNADPEQQHIRIIGQPDGPNTPDLETIVRQRIGEQTIRKNAVLAVEFLLTASPEYFRPDEPGRAGYYEPERLKDFQHQACGWLSNNYGDRIVRAELHLDEMTPHIHAYLVPLDDLGKLNCRALFGGSRYRLSELQDSFALAMTPLGLERGIKGSRATHTQIKEYYAAVVQSPDLTLDRDTINHQLADRQRALKEKAEIERTNKALALENQQLKLRLAKAGVEAYIHEESANEWKNKYQDLANEVRDIPLEEVAYELGLERDPKDKHKWENLDHIINITGSKFYDWKELGGGGGAIDLVMRVNKYDFKQSVAWLNDRFGESAMLTATSYHAREIAKNEPIPKFTPPVQEQDLWQQVRSYLTRERRLPSAVVDNLHQQGLIYADSQQNLVSIRRDLSGKKITGASLRGTEGTDNKFKGLARGSKRSDGWFYFERGGQSGDPIQRAVLVESPIDAISFAVLDRAKSKKTLYLSTDGAGQIPLEFLQKLPAQSVVVALDNDADGEKMAQKILDQLPRQAVRLRSKEKDWNEQLKKDLELKLEPSRKPEQQQSRGISL